MKEISSSRSKGGLDPASAAWHAEMKFKNDMQQLRAHGYATEKEYLLARNGYKKFEDFLIDSQIKTREEWERFANATRFHVFNDEYKQLHPEQYEEDHLND